MVRPSLLGLRDAEAPGADDPIAALLADAAFGRRYALIRKLGQGGMGAVYAMEDRELGRRVAVKIAIGTDADDRARFAREARLLAQLSHPNILKVFSAEMVGQTPVLVTELLEGWTLDAEGPNDLASALKTVEMVLAGLEAAHRGGIIHRDLKPQNILRVAGGSLKLLDFGLAKRPAQRDAGVPSVTQAGMILGTPEYMSPEQCRAAELDARSDLYQVGVILFQLVSGRLPFIADTPMDFVLKHIRDDPPDLLHVAPGVPRSLGALVRKALAKTPAERFASAAEMQAAVRAVATKLRAAKLETVPVAPEVIPARRAPSPRAAVALVAATLVLVSVSALVRPPPPAPPPPPRPSSAPRQPKPVTLEPAVVIEQRPALLRERVLALRWAQDLASLLIVTETGRCYTWRAQKLIERVGVVPAIGSTIAVSPDLGTVAVARESTIQLYKVGTSPAQTRAIEVQAALGAIIRIAFSSDGKTLATASSRNSIDLWNVPDGQHLVKLPGATTDAKHIQFLADGRVAALMQTPRLLVWDAAHAPDRAPRVVMFSQLVNDRWRPVTSVALSPDGRTLAALDGRNDLHVVDLAGNAETWDHDRRAISPRSQLAFSPDGKRLATLGTHDREVQFENVPYTGPERGPAEGALSQVVDLRFAKDTLAASFADQRLTFFELRQPARPPDARPVLTAAGEAVQFFNISADMKSAMSGGFEKRLKFWSLLDGTERPVPDDPLYVPQRSGLSADGHSAVVVWKGIERCFSVVDIRDGTVRRAREALKNADIEQVALSRDGRIAALAPMTGPVQLREQGARLPRTVASSLTDEIRCLAFTPDDRLVEIRRDSTRISLWTLAPRLSRIDLPATGHDIVACAVSPDGKLLATGEAGGQVGLRDLDSGDLRAECAGARGIIRKVAFSADGKRLAAGGEDTRIIIWDVPVPGGRPE